MEPNTVHTVFVYFPENEPILIGGYIGEPQIARGKKIMRNKFSAQKVLSPQCPTQLLVAKCAAETEWGPP